MISPSVDYRTFRFSKLCSPEFSHVWLLLFWPAFGLLFSYVERFYPAAHYIEMHCALDDLIPFNEWFIFPYCSWFVLLAAVTALLWWFDTASYDKLCLMMFSGMTLCLIIYMVAMYRMGLFCVNDLAAGGTLYLMR